MRIELDVRDGEVTAFTRSVFARQMPFATARAINWTAKDFQGRQVGHMTETFTVRRPQFVKYSVKIRPFATKEKQEATVRIDSPGGRSDIFAKFEADRIKSPFGVGRSIAVPTEHVPRTGAGVIQRPWRPRTLLAGNGSSTTVRGRSVRGRRGTFLVRKPSGRGTLFQRTDKDTVVPLYQLVPQVGIEPDLRFVDNAEREINARWASHFTRSFEQAVRTAR